MIYTPQQPKQHKGPAKHCPKCEDYFYNKSDCEIIVEVGMCGWCYEQLIEKSK